MEFLRSPAGTGEIVSSSLALVASLLLYMAYPALVTWKVSCRTHTQRKFHPTPFLPFYWSSVYWLLYVKSVYKYFGFPPTLFHVYCRLISMGAGQTFPLLYSMIHLFLFDPRHQSMKFDVVLFFLMVVPVMAIILLIITMAVDGGKTVDGMVPYDGPIAIFFGIIMYASPLPIIMDGHKDDVSDYLPSWLCSGLLLNSFAWVIVAFNVPNFDHYFTVTNVIGIIMTSSQLVLIHGFLELSIVIIHGVFKFLSGVWTILHWAGCSCLAFVIMFYGYVLLIGPLLMSQA